MMEDHESRRRMKRFRELQRVADRAFAAAEKLDDLHGNSRNDGRNGPAVRWTSEVVMEVIRRARAGGYAPESRAREIAELLALALALESHLARETGAQQDREPWEEDPDAWKRA